MLYIITEDSKSGYEFWKIVFESYLKENEYINKCGCRKQVITQNI